MSLLPDVLHEPGHPVGALQYARHLELAGRDRSCLDQVGAELGERARCDLVGGDLGELLQGPVAGVLLRLFTQDLVHLAVGKDMSICRSERVVFRFCVFEWLVRGREKKHASHLNRFVLLIQCVRDFGEGLIDQVLQQLHKSTIVILFHLLQT